MNISIPSSYHRLRLPFLALAALLPAISRADIAIVIEEFADKVVVRYSGSLDTTSFMTFADVWSSELDPGESQVYFSDDGGSPSNSFETVSGDPVTNDPAAFGPGFGEFSGVFEGDYFVITRSVLAYPFGYVSGSPLSGSLTYAGKTLESLGIDRNLAPGYTWELTSGESVSLEVVTRLDKLIQQTATKKAALLKAMRKLNKDLNAAIRSGKIAKVKKLKKSITKITKQIAAL